jgi:hypothetical protein
MLITGKTIIDKLCQRLIDTGTRCHDANIVNLLRELDEKEVNQLFMLGDVCEWHNERINHMPEDKQ